MKKYIFIVVLTHFILLSGSECKKRLLFPFPQKSVNDLWQLVRQNWHVYHCILESLPLEINQIIARFLIVLNNPKSFSTHQDQFFRRLLGCCLMLSFKEKEWELPIDITFTHDGNYYAQKSIMNSVLLCDSKTQRIVKFFTEKFLCEMLKTRNILLLKNIQNFHEYFLSEILSENEYYLGELYDICISESEKYIAGVGADKTVQVWNIQDFKEITCLKITSEFSELELIKFSSDDSYIVLKNKSDEFIILQRTDTELKLLSQAEIDTIFPIIFAQELKEADRIYPIIKRTSVKHKSFAIKEEIVIDGKTPVRNIFNIADHAFNVLYQKNSQTKESFFNHLKEILFEGKITIYGVSIGSHMFCKAQRLCFSDFPIIAHVIHDKKGDYIERDIIKGAERITHSYKFNRQETLFVAPLDEKTMGCFDFRGNNLVSFEAQEAYFHQNGRAVLYQDSYENRKKLVLYPKGADNHLRNIAYSSLTVAKYIALEKICKKVQEETKQNNLIFGNNARFFR